jgi:hypothetical protein
VRGVKAVSAARLREAVDQVKEICRGHRLRAVVDAELVEHVFDVGPDGLG